MVASGLRPERKRAYDLYIFLFIYFLYMAYKAVLNAKCKTDVSPKVTSGRALCTMLLLTHCVPTGFIGGVRNGRFVNRPYWEVSPTPPQLR